MSEMAVYKLSPVNCAETVIAVIRASVESSNMRFEILRFTSVGLIAFSFMRRLISAWKFPSRTVWTHTIRRSRMDSRDRPFVSKLVPASALVLISCVSTIIACSDLSNTRMLSLTNAERFLLFASVRSSKSP